VKIIKRDTIKYVKIGDFEKKSIKICVAYSLISRKCSSIFGKGLK